MTYTVQYSRTYPTTTSDAFGKVLAEDLTELFAARTAAIAPITEVRDQQGAWGTPGQSRTIVLKDGTTMRETLQQVRPPQVFAYRIAVVSGAMKLLVGGADGRWELTRMPRGAISLAAVRISPTSACFEAA